MNENELLDQFAIRQDGTWRAHVITLPWIDMSSWDHEPIPEREWAIPDRVPLKQAGLFSGEGGTGKSNIELTKDVARVTGKGWFGSMPEPGPAITLVEAIKQSVRDGGIAVLKEPATRDRLSQCDRAARAEIDRWLTRFKSKVPA
jgi:hypothetical protein